MDWLDKRVTTVECTDSGEYRALDSTENIVIDNCDWLIVSGLPCDLERETKLYTRSCKAKVETKGAKKILVIGSRK